MEAVGADGCGLFRTEFAFMTRSRYPDVADPGGPLPGGAGHRRQPAGRRSVRSTSAATSICPTGACRPRTIRPWAGGPCGWCWTGPTMLRGQLRALLLAASGRHAAGHVPDGRRGGRARCRAAAARPWSWSVRRRAASPLPTQLEVGAMVEVPSLYWQLKALLRAGRFPVDRQQRPVPVPVRLRSGQSRRWSIATTCCRRRR